MGLEHNVENLAGLSDEFLVDLFVFVHLFAGGNQMIEVQGVVNGGRGLK